MSDQCRALRVRTFATFVQENKSNGAYIGIATPLSPVGACASRASASSFPTTLKRINHEQFDKLAVHGAGVAERVKNEFGLADAA
jgi:NTE family protein